MEHEIDGRIGAASAVKSVVVKKEQNQKAKLSIDKPIQFLTLTYRHELWVRTERMRSQIQAAKMSFLHWAAEHILGSSL